MSGMNFSFNFITAAAASLAILVSLPGISCGAFTLKCTTNSPAAAKEFRESTQSFLDKVFKVQKCRKDKIGYDPNPYLDCIFDLKLPELYETEVEDWTLSNVGNKLSFKKSVMAAGKNVCMILNEPRALLPDHQKRIEDVIVTGGVELVEAKPKPTVFNQHKSSGNNNTSSLKKRNTALIIAVCVLSAILVLMVIFILVSYIRKRKRGNTGKADNITLKPDNSCDFDEAQGSSLSSSVIDDSYAPPSYEDIKPKL